MSRLPALVWRREDTPAELFELLYALGEEYPVDDGGRGVRLRFRRVGADGTLVRVVRSAGEALVEYSSVAAAARGIGAALAGRDGEEVSPFRTLGVMLDVSRNMVMRTDHIRMWLRRLSLCGYNLAMLYTEDVYRLQGEPFFGYMRGAYSKDEIRELDAYASKLGVELVGCIQTLGHLGQILRWRGAYGGVADTSTVLMVDEPRTYELIDKMAAFWSEALGSRRIHVGMDETHDLGRGRFMDRRGYESAFELFNRHLGRVNGICGKHGLSPMIWSDMYFRLSNPELNYYDVASPIPEDVRRKIPDNVRLVYWDYYHEDAATYEKMIQRHRDIGFEPVMASGIRTWKRLWYDHDLTKSTVIPCIEACRGMRVRELFFTMWGDDGGYCNYDSALAGAVYSADLAFGADPDDVRSTAARFGAVCGGNFRACAAAGGIQAKLTSNGESYTVSPAALIWDDPLQGVYFDECLRRDPEFEPKILAFYEKLLGRLVPHEEDKSAGDFEHIVNALDLLIKKIELRDTLVTAYDVDDRAALRMVAASMIPAVIAAVREFDSSFRAQWLVCAKPFGLETIQIRNAGLIARLEETARRVREYLDGLVDGIDELESPAAADGVFNLAEPDYSEVCSGSAIH